MKEMFCWLLASVFLGTSKGQCLLNSNDTGVIVPRCKSSVYKDLVVYIDFYKINSSCTCIVSPMFAGDLSVLLKQSNTTECNTQVKINSDFMFNCTVQKGYKHTFKVQNDQLVRVQAQYTQPSKQATFHQCLEFRQYGGTDGDLSINCSPPAASAATTTSTTRSTTTTPSKTTTTTTSTTPPTTTTPLQTTLTTTTPSTHSRLTNVIVPSKEATVTINMNTDVITNSKEATSACLGSSTMDTTPDKSQNAIYIAGFAAGGVIILIGLIICILAMIKREKLKRTEDKSKEEESAPTNDEIFHFNNTLTENILYVSSDEVEVRYTEEEKQPCNSSATYSKTKLESNRDHDDGLSVNQPIDSVSVYAVPNMSSISHTEIDIKDVYAQVYKQNKSTAQVHDSVHTQN